MNNQLKFQEQLKSQILKFGIVSMLVLLTIFYIGTYLFNLNYDNTRLKTNNNYLEERINYLFETVNNTNEELLNLEDITQTTTIYNYLYKTNSTLNVKSNFLIFDINKNTIFSSDLDIEKHGSFKQYINILLKNLDDNLDNYISVKPINYDNQLLIGSKSNNRYAITIISETDLINFLDRTSSYVVIDKKNHVVVSNNYRFINNIYKFIPNNSNFIEIDDASYQYLIKPMTNNLSVISFVLKQTVVDMKQIGLVIVLLGLFFTFLLNTFSNKLSKNTSKSLDKLMDQIEEIKKERSKFIGDINTNDEFEVLSKEINNMLKNIDNLNSRNTELLDLNKQIEIKQLESQFNSHFLYNTLETIRYVMYVDTKLASDLILKLTGILRYSISPTEDEVKLSKDIMYIENYLEICKVRFQERFNYTLKIDDNCKDLLIPKLIFHPIIENSVKHNFKNKASLSIWVTSEIIDNKLHIEVEDNGDGMSEIDLNILNTIIKNEDNKTTHIGLYNVYRRLKLKYGNDFKFEIYSKKDIGTRIIIVIPLSIGEYENV